MNPFRIKTHTFSGIITLMASKVSSFFCCGGLVLILCVLVFSVLNLLCLVKKWVALEETVIE